MSPLLDEKNPCYCPAIPAAVYLKSLRSRNRVKGYRQPYLSNSFARILEQSSYNHGGLDSEGENTLGSDWILRDVIAGRGRFSSEPHVPEDLPPYSPTVTVPAQLSQALRNSGSAVGKHDLKRKNSFSDFGAPPKYARSVQSVHASSFDIEVHHEKLEYNFGIGSSPGKTEDILQGLGLLHEDLGILIGKLSAALPGIRLKERLCQLQHGTPQLIMDFLGENGYINDRVLDIFRHSAVECIIFSPSMLNENGLNLAAGEIYSVFGNPNNFRSLSDLSFAGIRIRDSDLRHVHHLPNLSILNLNETGIGNEGVFLLVSLKRTLRRLFLATNPDIDNDAIPAILLLSKLSFLSILDTGIDMIGLRRLGKAMQDYNWIMDIEIPFVCEAYVDGINSQYLYNPLPPLITNPNSCSQLSSVALKRNLEAHAACNPLIVPSGTRPEMLDRLSDILQTRKLDMLVISMLEGNESFVGNGREVVLPTSS